MNKILIFAGAKESSLLIKKISDNFLNIGEFHIIYEDEEIIQNIEKRENLFFYKINFFAYENYKNLLFQNFNKIIIFVKNKNEASFLIKKLKYSKTPILIVKFWLEFEIDNHNNNLLEILDVPEIITNKVIDFLPGVPLYGRDIGLGIGEILEVEIPTFSPFVYKSPNYIEEKYNVKVAAIYRGNSLKKINEHTLILPNDKLLIIGNPEVLKDLYNQIRKNVGAFPQPYGQNIYLILDMKNMDKKEMSSLLKAALFLHRKLKNKKLIIRIINPSTKLKIYKLFKFPNIEIETNYFITKYNEILLQDSKKFNIGLIITNNNFFFKYSNIFFSIKKPIFKKGNESIKKCKSLIVLLNQDIKKIASVIFDLSYQLDLKLKFLSADPEKNNNTLVEYLKYLAKLFNFKNVEFTSTKENPILKLQSQKNLCIIETFTKPVSKIKQILFPKIEHSYILLDKFNQFLIPIKEDNES